MKFSSLTSPIVTAIDLYSHSNIASESLGMKTNELGSDRRGKLVLYDCIAIKVRLKHLENQKMFCKETAIFRLSVLDRS